MCCPRAEDRPIFEDLRSRGQGQGLDLRGQGLQNVSSRTPPLVMIMTLSRTRIMIGDGPLAKAYPSHDSNPNVRHGDSHSADHIFIYFFHQAQRLNYAHYASSYTVSISIYASDTVLDEVMAKD